MSKKIGLGRGLGALFPDDDETAATPSEGAMPNASREVAIHLLDPNRDQPRKRFDDAALADLADSIRSSGIIQPLIVRVDGDRYRIVAGERRWRAAKIAGLKEVPVLVRDYSDVEMMEIALIENIQRADLNPVEEASGIQALIDEHHLTQEEVSGRLGRSRPAIANALRILRLPESVLGLLRDGQITSGHARCLITLPSQAMQEEMAAEIIRRSLSVRQTEAICKARAAGEASESKRATPQNPELFEVQNHLQSQLETKVKITGSLKRGRISIEYYSEDQLERIYEYLRREV